MAGAAWAARASTVSAAKARRGRRRGDFMRTRKTVKPTDKSERAMGVATVKMV
jgi:hypothetical protein